MAAAERQVFEQVTRNAPLPEVLTSITGLIESGIGGALSAVSVLADDGQTFASMVAPRVPEALRAALQSAAIGIRTGSCAACVYLGRQVLVADVGKDPFWIEPRAAGGGRRAAGRLVDAHQGRRRAGTRVARGVPHHGRRAEPGGGAGHGARRAAGRDRDRAAPGRGGAALERSEVPRPL